MIFKYGKYIFSCTLDVISIIERFCIYEAVLIVKRYCTSSLRQPRMHMDDWDYWYKLLREKNTLIRYRWQDALIKCSLFKITNAN